MGTILADMKMSEHIASALSPQDIEAGVALCFENAGHLRSASLLLLEPEPGIAVALCCLRVEELVKVQLLCDLRDGARNAKGFARAWNDHRAKWEIFHDMTITKAVKGWTAQDRAEAMARAGENVAPFRNYGLYVDWNSKSGSWRAPRQIDWRDGQGPDPYLWMGDRLLHELNVSGAATAQRP